MIVIDASALVDVLLRRRPALAALLEAGHPDEPLHAPALIDPETLNAFRGMVLRGYVTDGRAGEAVTDLGRVRMVRYPHGPFRERVWELRHELTAYDATYLALAERIDGATFLTADRPLAGHARASLGADAVRLVA